MASKSTRKPRTATDRFDGQSLLDDLRAFARLKDLGWDWELSNYAKLKRSQAPDRAGLESYAELMLVVLKHAPRGFPNHMLLRDVWLELDKQYNIRDSRIPATTRQLDWANNCAEAVRTASRHVVDLRRSRTRFLSSTLQQLVDSVDDAPILAIEDAPARALAPPPAPPPAPPAADTPTQRQLAHRRSDESSVVFCGFKCECDRCKSHIDVPSSQSLPPSPVSDTSVAARANAQFVPASRGGQKNAARKRPAASIATSHAKPAAATAATTGAFKVVKRFKPTARKEAYILHDGKFLLTLTAKRAEDCNDLMEVLAAELERGDVSPDAAKVRLAELIRANEAARSCV